MTRTAQPMGHHMTLLATLPVFLLGALAAACGGDGPGKTDSADDVEVAPDVEDFPDFTIDIEATRLSGNAPLSIDFSAVVGGVAADLLTYRWLVDGSPLGTERTFTHEFFRAGSSTVVLEATYTRGDGETKVADATSIVSVRACADLRFDRFTVDAPTELPPGGHLRVKFAKLFNDGDAIDDAFQIGLGLSIDEHFDPATDILVIGPTYSSMTQGLSADSTIDMAGVTFDLPEDIEVGSYYVFLVADPGATVNECQEANNLEPSTNSIVIDPNAGKLPNLVLELFDLPADLTEAQGDILNYSFRIRNTGEADAKQFHYAFWLSSDNVLSPDTDRPISLATDEGSRVQSIAAGAAQGFFKSYRIPADLPDGEWWIVGRVDALDQIGESDENDNVVVSSSPFTMHFEVPQCADLKLERLLVSPLSTYWGGTVQLKATISNPGTEDVPEGWLFRAYLSLQPTLNPSSSTVVGTYPLGAVPAGETRDFEILIPISDDLPVVPHYVAGLVDPNDAVAVCCETYISGVFGDPLKINATASVDVGVERFDYHPQVVAAGDTLKAEYDLENHGTSIATTFQVGVVISADGIFSREAIAAGRAIVIDRLTVGSLQPDELVTEIRDVVVPTGLDHSVTAYYVAVLADLDGFITSDTNFSNNLKTSDKQLTITGAIGGCFEDGNEPDDTRLDATPMLPGTTSGLGSCGDADWLEVAIPAGHSLLVDIDARPIVAFPAVSSNLIVQLVDPGGVVVQEAVFGPHYEVRAFAVPSAGTYAVRIAGATAADRAAYDVSIVDQPPRTGIDVVAYAVSPAPATSYPGGRLAVAWREVNLGTQPAPVRVTRVWLSKDRALDGNDLALGEAASAPLGPSTTVGRDVNVGVPSNVPGGSWYVLVEADADGDVSEVDEVNNLSAGGPIVLDPLKVCNDDTREPNDEIGIATLLGPDERVSDAVVCPGLDDWYALELDIGETFEAEVAYDYDPSKGKLVLELWDPDGQAALVTESRTGTMRVELPSAWIAGRWLLRVANEVSPLSAPYHYDLAVSVAPGPIAARCIGDQYEGDNAPAYAVGIGCGAITGTLCNLDVDWYVVQGKGAQKLDIQLTNSKSEIYTKLFLPGSTTNAVSTIWGSGTTSYTPASNGPLLIKIEPRSGPTTMTAFDYTLKVTGLDGADLALTQLESPFDAVDRGEDAGVSLVVSNQCTAAAGSFEVGAFLSIDDGLGVDDVPLGSWPVDGLGPNAQLSLEPKVTIPYSTAPGLYWLVMQADADLAVPEGNEVDNIAAVPMEIREPCEPDAHEPNDTRGAAWSLTLPGDESDLTICPNDQDWFRVAVQAGDRLHVAALFHQVDGDLDLRVYDGTGAVPIAVSQSTDDDEDILVDVPLTTTLYIRVAGYGSSSAPYRLIVDVE